MAGVFVSYRRSDSDVAAGRLAGDLAEILGVANVFRDLDTLAVGQDYVTALDEALDSCVALIAVIGPRWSSVTDEEGRRRLDDPRDWVRVEIARALERGIRVIPVLVSAEMPGEDELPEDLRPLHRRMALELSDRHWRQDIAVLAEALARVPGIAGQFPAVRSPENLSTRLRTAIPAILFGVGGLVILVVVGWLAWQQWGAPEPRSRQETVAPAEPDAAVDLSQWVRIRDSGSEGAVAGLAMVTAMEASLARQGRPVTLSARYLYEKAKSVDRYDPQTEGTDMAAALYVAETFGAPPEDRWPYVAGSRELPPGTSLQSLDKAAARFRALVYRLARPDEIADQLMQGRPILAAVTVTADWLSPETATTGRIELRDDQQFMGKHAVVIVAADPSVSWIKFANSWGVEWGDNGFGKMSREAADSMVSEMWAVEIPVATP